MKLVYSIDSAFRIARGASLVAAITVSASSPLLAAAKQTDTSQAARYDHCESLVNSNAKAALQQAQIWRNEEGSASAMHCEALALVALKRYAEAADILATLAGDNAIETVMRAQLYDQAGNVWLLAAEPGKALPLFTAALGIVPHDVDNLTDRARARAMHGDWDGAESDLTIALAGDPERADLLVLRASAYHAMGRKPDALADIAHALDVLPFYPEALLERGSIKLENGDIAGARSDWQTVAAKSSDAAQVVTARERLQQLDAVAAPQKPAKKH